MKGKVRILAAMFFMQFILSAGGTVLNPLLAAIETSMPNVSQTLVSMLITLPMLVMIPTNLLSGLLGERMSKKTLFLIGSVLFLVGGIMPMFATSFTAILFWRAILGLGQGFVFPLGFAMLPDYFEGEAQQTASGIFNAGSLVLAIPVALIAGIIGATRWQNALWIYLFTFVPIVMVMTMIPNVERPAGHNTVKEKSPPPHVSTYITALAGLVFYVGMTVLTLTISYFLATLLPLEAVGGIAGLGSALFSAGGIVASLLYGKIATVTGKWIGCFSFGVGSTALLLMFLVPTSTTVLVSMALGGICVGLTGPVLIMGAMAKSPWSASLTSAICMIGFNLGQFLCPYAVNGFMAIGNGSYPVVYLCGGLLVLLVAVYHLILAVKPAPVKPAQ